MEQFDDILRNFINETNKYVGSFGKIRWRKNSSSEKVDARDFAIAEELLIALENIITDKVTKLSATKVKKIDTIRMAAGTDDEETLEEVCGNTSELAVQAVYKGTGGQRWMERRNGSLPECTDILQQRQS